MPSSLGITFLVIPGRVTRRELGIRSHHAGVWIPDLPLRRQFGMTAVYPETGTISRIGGCGPARLIALTIRLCRLCVCSDTLTVKASLLNVSSARRAKFLEHQRTAEVREASLAHTGRTQMEITRRSLGTAALGAALLPALPLNAQDAPGG